MHNNDDDQIIGAWVRMAFDDSGRWYEGYVSFGQYDPQTGKDTFGVNHDSIALYTDLEALESPGKVGDYTVRGIIYRTLSGGPVKLAGASRPEGVER